MVVGAALAVGPCFSFIMVFSTYINCFFVYTPSPSYRALFFCLTSDTNIQHCLPGQDLS